MKRPSIPKSPSQLPPQRIVQIADLPERPAPFDAVVGWGKKPAGVELRNGPREADYLGQVEWAWSPMNGRVDAYYLSRSRSYWILWTKWYDDNWGRWEWLALGHVPRKQASRMEAAVNLLVDFWRMEREKTELDHFHWLNDEGDLDASQWRTIGFMVWPPNTGVRENG